MTQRSRYPTGLFCLSSLLKTIVTLAFVTPACPCLYTSSDRFPTRTCVRFEMPRTKQIASKMFDFPLPFRPPMAKTITRCYKTSTAVHSIRNLLFECKKIWLSCAGNPVLIPVVLAWWSVKMDCSLQWVEPLFTMREMELTRIPGMQNHLFLVALFHANMPCQHILFN